jgi:hypothetical protein
VRHGEGLNLGKQGGVAKLDLAMNPNGGAFCRRLIAQPALDIGSLEPKYLNLSGEAPHAEPHEECCGDWGRKSPGYPIRLQPLRVIVLILEPI